jgi:hypothetical protein
MCAVEIMGAVQTSPFDPLFLLFLCRDPHSNDGLKNQRTPGIHDLHRDRQFGRRTPLRWRLNDRCGLQVRRRLVQVLDGHALRNPAMGPWDGDLSRHACRKLRHIAHRDRMDRADVIEHCSTPGNAQFTAARLEVRESWPDRGEIGRLPANQRREQPAASRSFRKAAPHRQKRTGRAHIEMRLNNS